MFDDLKAALRDDPVESFTRSHLADRFEEIRRVKGAIARYEARLVTATDRLGDKGVDGAGMLRSAGRMSSKAASTAARTANSLEALPQTAEALEQGRITVEHAAAVAAAAEKVSPELADAELVESAASAPADVFAKRSREWAGRNRVDDGSEEHDRQRRNRQSKHWVSDEGMWMFLLEFDAVTGAAVKSRHDARCDALWRADGGRDGSPDDQRTPTQRSADAFAELLLADAASGGRPHPKYQVNVVYDINGQTTADGKPLATMVVDGVPLPQAVLDRIACDSAITPMIFDGPSKPIWVGRDYRTASIDQWKALIARDRGCIGCGVSPDHCEAHHIVPWGSWGNTDITNLVLVCSKCHHDLHDRGMVLRRSDGKWRIECRAGPTPVPQADRSFDRQFHLTA
jgi:hypothetical protein